MCLYPINWNKNTALFNGFAGKCFAAVGAMRHWESRTIQNQKEAYPSYGFFALGSATASCNNGVISLSGASCSAVSGCSLGWCPANGPCTNIHWSNYSASSELFSPSQCLTKCDIEAAKSSTAGTHRACFYDCTATNCPAARTYPNK